MAEKARDEFLKRPVAMTAAAMATVAVIVLALCSFGQTTSRTFFGPKEVLTTAVEIKIDPTREESTATFPAGSPVRVLKSTNTGEAVILIGETKEQAIVPLNAIVEAGGTGGNPITVESIHPPTRMSIVRHDGPEGIWTGIATGDENIPSSNPEFEQEIFRLTNLERTKRGISPLVWDEDLARAARYHAGDTYVQGYNGHFTKDTITRNGQDDGEMKVESYQDRISRFLRTPRKVVSENLQARRNDASAKKLMEVWMGSPNHRANILEPRFRRLGVGYITTNAGQFGWACTAQAFSTN